jgi:hypothetical protein
MNEMETLFEAELVPDLDTLLEMGAGSVVDENLRNGSRVLILRRDDGAQVDGAVMVRLDCAFQAAPGVRFSAAHLMVKLIQPQGAMFRDIEPREIKTPVKVEIALQAGGKLSAKFEPFSGEASASGACKETYDSYITPVTGSGWNTIRAEWFFNEDEALQKGVQTHQTLTMALSAEKTVKAELLVSAQIQRVGLLGKALRMIPGGKFLESRPEVTLYQAS